MKSFKNATATEKWVLVSVLFILLSSFALLLLAIAGFGSGVANCVSNMRPFEKGELIQHDPHHFEIHYVAKMWHFEPAEVTIPPRSTVDIYLTSGDVTHGFIIPGTNVNMMAVPGAVNYTRVKFDERGIRTVICHEYCGAGHQEMAAKITVADVGMGQEALPPEIAKNIPPGRKVMEQKGCVSCHTTDGTPSTGPTLKGIFNSKVVFSDGSSAVADETYLRESILSPGTKIVKGFQNIMPTFLMSEPELHDVVEYLKSLK